MTQIAMIQGHSDLAVRVDAGHLKYFFHRLWNGGDGLGDPIEGTLRVCPRREGVPDGLLGRPPDDAR